MTEQICPSCGGLVQFDHEDDTHTKWFKCTLCGQQTTKPLKVDIPRKEETPTPEQVDAIICKATVKDSPPRMLTPDNPDAKLSQADKLILLCQSRRPVLFTDQTGAAYAKIDVSGVNVIWPLRSAVFKSWLAGLLWASEQKAPSVTATYSALNVLFSMAQNSGHKYALYNRVALGEDGGFWLDMTDQQWRAIKITKDGWEVVENPPILFKRYSHQLPLVEPKAGGNAWKILDFFNIDMDDENTKLTTLTTGISYLIPNIPHPIICAYGHQGSAKSYLFKLIRRLLDPSAVELLSLPYEERERVQQLDHHWLCFYDNITYLSTQVSDTLCRAATGAGFSKRELYSDDEDVIYNFRRCVGLNGINVAASRGDLLDRSLLVSMCDIPKGKRKTERQIDSEFEACKAEILGGFLDVLVKAMNLYPTVNPKDLFRMADYIRWGACIAIALGKTADDFIGAYEVKVNEQIEEAAHSSSVATVLLSLLEGTDGWSCTPTELHVQLINHAKTLEISTRTKGWPKAPHILTRTLNELAPSLKALGWEINALRTGGQRKIDIKRVTSDTEAKKKEEGNTSSLPSQASPPSLEVASQVASPIPYGKSMDCDASDASDATFLSSIYFSLKKTFHSPFTEQDALAIIKTHSSDETKAEAAFHVFIKEGKIAMDPEGLWWFV